MIPDRSHILAEQRNPRSADLHGCSVAECLDLIHREDAEVLAAVESAKPAIAAFVSAIEPGFVAGGRLIYIGAGTSGRLGVLDASEAPPTFHVDPGRIVGIIAGGDGALRRSSEGKEDEEHGAGPELEALRLTGRDAVMGIAAGGTTPYARGGVGIAKRLGAGVTAFLSCSPVDAPAGCDHLIVAPTGAEVVTGSTRMKAGTATKLILNMISTTLMVRAGKVYGNLMVDVRATNVKLRDRAARIIGAIESIPRDQAFAVLDAGGGHVKTALVMHRLGVTKADAVRRLEDAGGRLGDVFGEFRTGSR